MNKLLVSTIFVMAAGISAMAQNPIFNNPYNKAYFGIRVAGEVTCPGKMSASNVSIDILNNGGGVEFGGIYNMPVVANFYIEPGLKLYYNTYSFKKEFVELLQDDIIYNGITMKKFGMRIPVMAGYHFDFTDDIKVSIFTGPELEVGFSAKEHTYGHNIEFTTNLYGEYGDLNRVDLLWGIGAGIGYQHFYFSVSGHLGMLNMLSDSVTKFHENRVSFNVGYNF